MKETNKLKSLPFLRALALSENPVADEDDYRLEVLIAVRTLERLDKDEFTDEERHEAEEIYEQRKAEAEAAEVIFTLKIGTVMFIGLVFSFYSEQLQTAFQRVQMRTIYLKSSNENCLSQNNSLLSFAVICFSLWRAKLCSKNFQQIFVLVFRNWVSTVWIFIDCRK